MNAILNGLAATLATILIASPALAAGTEEPAPTADSIVRAMNAALAPDRTSTRSIEIEVRTPDGGTTAWSARQARKTVDGKRRILTVVVAPAAVAGFAILSEERQGSADTQWVYLPPVRRVRRVLYEGHFDNFLGTDLSIEDFGFASLEASDVTLEGIVQTGDVETWALREVPKAPSGYSRIVTLVSTATNLPVRREYHDAAGALWKTQNFENVTVIGGVPTPLQVTMVNDQEGGSTTLRIREVDFSKELADSLFRPEALPAALDQATW